MFYYRANPSYSLAPSQIRGSLLLDGTFLDAMPERAFLCLY